MHTLKSSNHVVTKFATFVHVVCDIICTKFVTNDEPKFADPSMAVVSSYFKRSMQQIWLCRNFFVGKRSA